MDSKHIADRLEQNRARFDALAARAAKDPDCRYAPGKWTARELLAHLADCEFINLWRFCRAVAEPGSSVLPFEENQWAARLDYGTRPVPLSKDLFLAARALLMHHVRSRSESDLAGTCIHPEKGTMSGFDWAVLSFDHAEHHLGQVEAALDRKAWSPIAVKDSWKFGVKARD